MKIFAVFSFRYDYKMVPDLLKNLEGIIDDYVFWDDRNRDETDLYFHEGKTRNWLINEAKRKGADWILGIDPDERFEKNAGTIIRQLIKEKKKIIYGFEYRELWSPDSYRIDGVWGSKKKFSLFPVFPDQEFMSLRVHCQWHPVNPGYEFMETGLNLYHLKMIDPRNREDRKKLYNQLDPHKNIQKIGYDYLANEENIKLEKIIAEKDYYPKYREDYDVKRFMD